MQEELNRSTIVLYYIGCEVVMDWPFSCQDLYMYVQNYKILPMQLEFLLTVIL